MTQKKSIINLLGKKTCVHTEKKCNYLKPFSMLELHGKEKFTKDEKEENLRKYETSCSNQGGNFTECCDKNDKNLDKVSAKLKLNKMKGKVEYDRHGKIASIKLCKGKECTTDFKLLSSYEICKLGADYHKNMEDNVVKQFNPDCFLTQCNPQEKVPNILGTIEENYTYNMDKNLSNAIKKNDLPLIKYYIGKDPTLKTRVLTHNKEGNTIYHETLKYNSGNNLYYIFKQANKETAFKENMEGNTILHMAMGLDNKNAISFCIKLGCDINGKNNLGETPIFMAIKNNLIDNIRMSINHIASLEIKDKKGNTPLLFSLNLETKNVDIVRLLVDRGSDTKIKNRDGKDALQIIHSIKNPTIEDEEVRTYLEQVRIKNMGFGEGQHKLNLEQTQEMEGIVYNLTGQENLGEGRKPSFKISLEYTDDAENYYPDDLDEKYMQPHKPGNKNLSHEPYFNKFKNLQQDKLKILKDTILLTKWDNKNDKDKKLKIIDDIMYGQSDFDSYKYEVLNDNGIITEQEHLLFNDYSPGPGNSDSVTLQVKGDNHTPYNIYEGGKEINLVAAPTGTSPSPSMLAEEEIIKHFNINHAHVPPSISPYDSIDEDTDRDLFDIIIDFFNRNSTLLLVLAIIITICIIGFLYKKSGKLNFFN
jgi:hypothetical protein